MMSFSPNTLALAMICASRAQKTWTVKEVENAGELRGLDLDRVIFLKQPSTEAWEAAKAAVSFSNGEVVRAYAEAGK